MDVQFRMRYNQPLAQLNHRLMLVQFLFQSVCHVQVLSRNLHIFPIRRPDFMKTIINLNFNGFFVKKNHTIILVRGLNALTAVAMPAMRPPPPTGTTTASGNGTCSQISNPIVPCPAIIFG